MIPRLHLLTDAARLADPAFIATAERLLEAGGEGVALHLRAPGGPARILLDPVHGLEPAARRYGGRLLVNDRVDVALAVGAVGVHLPERSLPVEAARRLLGEDRLLGRSVHAPDPARQAEREGADYIVVGTIYATDSHPGVEGAGPARIREVSGAVSLPIMAVGGVTTARVGEVLEAGAHGVAVIGGVWSAPDPRSALEAYLNALEVG